MSSNRISDSTTLLLQRANDGDAAAEGEVMGFVPWRHDVSVVRGPGMHGGKHHRVTVSNLANEDV